MEANTDELLTQEKALFKTALVFTPISTSNASTVTVTQPEEDATLRTGSAVVPGPEDRAPKVAFSPLVQPGAVQRSAAAVTAASAQR